ncbi:MAG TPA: alpha/beta hydrolase [Nocardioidaceae bacterium]|nr:alpha/beta hydrolase [Nocardioidaceae bacterium]
MDLIPKPGQIAAASGNVAHKLLYGGLADLRTMPRTLIDEGNLREVYHYRPSGKLKETGDPILLVTPLAAPSLCFDLRRGCSLVEHFVKQGRRTYLVEYGEVSFKDRNLGVEHWIREVLPEAIRATSEHAGGRPVHLIGWSLGGIFGLLTTAALGDRLPIATLTMVGSPIDVKQVPLIAPIQPFLGAVGGSRYSVVSAAYRVMGGAPKPLVKKAFQFSAIDKVVTKPFVKLAKLDDTEFLAQLEAVDRFTANMIAYPGRTFGQLYHRVLRSNQLASGVLKYENYTVKLANVHVPVLAFGGLGDGIAPISCVRPIVDLLTGSPEVRWEEVPGGHLGMLTGRGARRTTWTIMDEWLDQHSSSAARTKPVKRAPAKKAAPTKRAPAKKAAAAKKAPAEPAAKRAAAKKAKPSVTSQIVSADVPDAPPADGPAIGSNKDRRYGSSASRSLGR